MLAPLPSFQSPFLLYIIPKSFPICSSSNHNQRKMISGFQFSLTQQTVTSNLNSPRQKPILSWKSIKNSHLSNNCMPRNRKEPHTSLCQKTFSCFGLISCRTSTENLVPFIFQTSTTFLLSMNL